MKFDKLKDESGSTMLLAIFLIVLVSIVIISFSVQVGNQIKSTMKTDKSMSDKYLAEGKLESELGNIIKDILDNTKVYAIKKNVSIYPDKSEYKLTHFKVEYRGSRMDLKEKLNIDNVKTEQDVKISIEIEAYENDYIIDSKFNIILDDLKEDKDIQKSEVEVGYKLNYEVSKWDKK